MDVEQIDGGFRLTKEDAEEAFQVLQTSQQSKSPPEKKHKKKQSNYHSKDKVAAKDEVRTQPINPAKKALDAIYTAAILKLAAAEEANIGYGYGPWAAGTNVTTFRVQGVAGDDLYVRFYEEGVTNPNSTWMMKYSDIKGMTIQQIRSKFGIKAKINRMTTVRLQPGDEVQVGEAAAVDNDGEILEGGGTQYNKLNGPGTPKVEYEIQEDMEIMNQVESGGPAYDIGNSYNSTNGFPSDDPNDEPEVPGDIIDPLP